ncbi:MAG TPA: ThiF family adenylyltransferase [Aggregatilineales bacterium]|nr:ThiF family adenylyltransferase [Aggregatilineales bacterium]
MNWDRVERLLGIETLDYLRQRKVAVIGLGSGGGFVATGLAMSGVASFVLIDDDKLEAHNVIRHVGDSSHIGQPKVEIVRDLILRRNPQAQVTAIKGRIEDHSDLLNDVDLVISAVDGEGVKYQINEICLKKHLTAVYAGVYERGEGGDVAVIKPYAGPCYACWASELRDGFVSPAPDGSGELDYGLINERGTLDAEPGLWLHVVRVATTQGDIALNMLLEDTPAHRRIPGNTVILANTALEIIEGHHTLPHSAEWVTIKRNPHCLVCGDGGRLPELSGQSLDTLAGDVILFEEEDEATQRLKGHSNE